MDHGPLVEHIACQKDLCKMQRNKSALGKATIAYRQQKLSWALDDEMCNALDEYEKSPRKCKFQMTIHECRHFYVTVFLEHAPATASVAMSESTLDPNKNTQQGLSGPNEFNVKRKIPSWCHYLFSPAQQTTCHHSHQFIKAQQLKLVRILILLVILILCYQWFCWNGMQEGHCVPCLLETQHVSCILVGENNI